MPFACHVAGGRVLLAPSAPQTYQIYGHREQKRMTTCSPANPRACHTWYIHRFDLDCGGVRTSWQSVVATLGPMLAESVSPPGAPYDDPAYAPQGRYRPGPGPAVTFPPGFAPNPMKVASFKGTRTAPAPLPAHVPLPPKKPATEAPAQVAEAAPNLPPATASPTSKAQTPGKAETTPKATKVAEHQPLKIEIVSGGGETEVVSGSDETTGSLPKADASSGSLWRDAAAVFAVTLGALLALSAMLLLRQRGVPALPMPVSFARLRGPAARRPLARASHKEREDAETEPDDAQDDTPANRLRLWDEAWLPGTMSEALDVLGVEPAASRDRIKSTVTRLRRALHPDYALDEEDRLLRERRLKQINVAWEIVSGKRRALFLSAKPRSS